MKKRFLFIFIVLMILLVLNCSLQGGNDEISFIELLKLTAGDAENLDRFGISVAIAGDYAIVGACEADNDRGAAYIYYRNQGGADKWGEVIKLTAGDAEDGDLFGGSVSVAGDYAIVGASFEDGEGSERGAAYIFDRNKEGEDNWGEVTKLTASDAADYDGFGNSVSAAGDYVIVGSCGADSGRGAAYIYYRNQGGADNWGEVTKLTASDAADYDGFGNSVSAAGDYVIVGSCGADSGRGAAYIFYRNGGGEDNWGEVTKLTASDAAGDDYFGISVSIAGDYIIVGAYGEDGSGSERGAAYIFYRNDGGEVTKLTASDAEDVDLFGYAVAISGDFAIVGAFYEDGTGNNNCGAAYIYYRNQGGADNWGEVTKLTASDAADADWFGSIVAMTEDYAIVGACGEDGAGVERGAAYIYEKE
jgi:hypothetical protein